jgi:anti-sigma factor RsiW
MSCDFHPSGEELLMAIDGELSGRQFARVESHLASCWACRVRKQELETAIADFIPFQRTSLGDHIPPADGPRALLRARLRQLSDGDSRPGWLHFLGRSPKGAHMRNQAIKEVGDPSVGTLDTAPVLSEPFKRLGWVTLAAALLIASVAPAVWHRFVQRSAAQPVVVTVPNPAFTPGAKVLSSQPNVCRETRAKNKIVPTSLQARVFAEYGIRTAGPGAYEVDYLITPALGGADDIHNLWPQSKKAGVWNAEVKDALEDRLHDMVCEGHLDLNVAQREIATNWIEAYKKYFHTDRPLGDTR